MAPDLQRGAWAYFPDRQEIRRNSMPQNYAIAEDCHRNGMAERTGMTSNSVSVRVSRRNEAHIVTITSSEGAVGGSCTCPDGLGGWECWHLVAALLYVSENIEDIRDAEEERRDAVDYFMGNLPQARILNFVSRQLKDDPALYDRLVRDLKLQNARVPRNYSKMMDRICAAGRADGEGNVTFGRIFGAARDARGAGKHAEAVRAYGGMAEYIITRMRDVEDADGYYKDCAIEAIDNMADSIIRQDAKPDKKRPYIKYLFKRALAPAYAAYRSHYADALEAICTEEEDMVYWLELIDSDAGAGSGAPAQLARMRAYALAGAGRWEEAADALSEHYSADPETCVRFVGILRRLGGQRALDGARKAVAAFRTEPRVMEATLPIFAGTGDEYLGILRGLFESTGDWGHFFKLKEAAGDWRGMLDEMSKSLMSGAPERAVDIYLKEGMRPEAMGVLESLDDHEMYAKYLSRLAKRFPGRYFESYGKRIRRLARSRTGRDHYGRVRGHLEGLRSIPESEGAFGTLLAAIKSENPGRRALLEALKGL